MAVPGRVCLELQAGARLVVNQMGPRVCGLARDADWQSKCCESVHSALSKAQEAMYSTTFSACPSETILQLSLAMIFNLFLQLKDVYVSAAAASYD